MMELTTANLQIDSYVNKPDKNFLIMIFVISFFAFIMGISLFDGSFKGLIGLVLLWTIATSAIIVIIYRELIHSPKTVKIVDDGIILEFRISPTRKLLWQELLCVDVYPGDLKTFIGRWRRQGVVQPINGLFYPVTYEAADAIAHSYFKRLGKFPPNSNRYNKHRTV